MLHPSPSGRVFLLILCILQALSEESYSEKNETWTHDLKMPGTVTSQEDAYIATHFPVSYPHLTSYIVMINPRPNYSTAHHMMLHGCSKPILDGMEEENSGFSPACDTLLYAWAHGAPGLRFPPGIGVVIGRSSGIKGFQLELHYLPKVTSPDHSGVTLILTSRPQPRSAGVFLMLSSDGVIPPRRKSFTIDISCRVPEGVQFTLMAIRTHAHSLGRVLMAYVKKPSRPSLQLLGRGNPQWPQAFYPLRDLNASFDSIDIIGGDILFARCVYDSTSRVSATSIGSTHNDEMCNVYMLYHSSPSFHHPEEASVCYTNEFPELGLQINEEIDVSDKSPISEQHAKHGLLGNADDQPLPKIGMPEALRIDFPHLGQLSAVATVQLPHGQELLILHRGEHVWDADFMEQGIDSRSRKVFITQPTVIHLDPATHKVKAKWGTGHFILPHGMTVSVNSGTQEPDAVFITDVALHQVFKFTWGKWDKPVWILGTPFQSGSSETQFCQPADVAVSSTGDIFVADGYCNMRVMKFSPNGTFLSQWPVENHDSRQGPSGVNPAIPRDNSEWYQLNSPQLQSLLLMRRFNNKNYGKSNTVVHSLTIIPPDSDNFEQVCAANREAARVLCYTTDGDLVAQYGGLGLQPTVYAVEYSLTHKILFAIVRANSGPHEADKSHGVLLNPVRPKSLQEFRQKLEVHEALDQSSAISGFFSMPEIDEPHDVTMSPDGRFLYLVENNGEGLYRFALGNSQDVKYDVISGSNPSPWRKTSDTSRWISRGHSEVWLAVLFMSVLLVTFIAVLICIRMCWCGRKAAGRVRTSSKSTTSRWSGRPSRAQKAGFRLLNQVGDGYEDGDTLDEDEDVYEDVLLQRNCMRSMNSVKVDAKCDKTPTAKSLQEVANGTVGTTTTYSSMRTWGVSPGEIQHSVAYCYI